MTGSVDTEAAPVPHAWLTPWRLRVYPVALLLAVGVAFVVFVARADGARSGNGRVGNDLPAFYGAGRMVNSGDGERLYDLDAQRVAQADLIPGGAGILPFAYPPFVAAVYAPLARLPYVPAYVVHTLLMLVAVGAGLWRLASTMPRVARHRVAAFAGTVLFYPLARSIFGGQNTAISVLCVSAAFTARTDVARGAWLGLWLFKPQLALPVLVVTALRRPRVLLGAAPVALAGWLLGAWVAGPDWVGRWVGAAGAFVELDRALNRSGSLSLVDLGVPAPVGLLGLLALVAVVAWRRPTVAILLVSGLAPVFSPHALFYDAGISIVGLLFAADALGRPAIGALAGVWAAAFLQLLPGPWSVPVCLAAAAMTWVAAAGRSSPAATAPRTPPRPR